MSPPKEAPFTEDVDKQILAMVTMLAFRHSLPPLLHVMVQTEANRIFGAFVCVSYDSTGVESAASTIECLQELDVKAGGNVVDIAGVLAKKAPDVPLVLDQPLFDMLEPHIVIWVDQANGHARLVGLPGSGTLSLYVPYKMKSIRTDDVSTVSLYGD